MKVEDYHFFSHDENKIIESLKAAQLIEQLKKMLLIRNFELRAEIAYQQGQIGGFFHSYVGQEAIQTACVLAMGENHWYTTTYRCHGLALLLGATPDELMAELFGKATGNTKGRGGSMHFFMDNMMGGFAIVGGHVPVATGAAFTIKYLNIKDKISVCFLGDGAVAQGAFHEALNLASLWDLPCVYIIENNKWGMGTRVEKAISAIPIAERKAPGYSMEGYSLDGMDFFNCYAGFRHVYERVKETGRPLLVEAVAERFKGHSISDPGLYRTKEDLESAMERDPILLLKRALIKNNLIKEGDYEIFDEAMKKVVKEAVEFADKSPWPDPTQLEEEVMKRNDTSS